MRKREYAYICQNCNEGVNKANRTQHDMRDAYQTATHTYYLERQQELLTQLKEVTYVNGDKEQGFGV